MCTTQHQHITQRQRAALCTPSFFRLWVFGTISSFFTFCGLNCFDSRLETLNVDTTVVGCCGLCIPQRHAKAYMFKAATMAQVAGMAADDAAAKALASVRVVQAFRIAQQAAIVVRAQARAMPSNQGNTALHQTTFVEASLLDGFCGAFVGG